MNENKIKILHTIRQGDFGGGETYLYNLVTRLNKSQFEPIVLSFTEGAMVEKLRKEGIKTYVILTLMPFNIFIYPKILRILRQEKIDLLHIHGTRAATNTLIPALLKKIKIIYTVHGWSFHTGHTALVTRLRILSEKFFTRFAHLTICGSLADIEQGKKYCPDGNYQLIRNSIDTTLFNPYSHLQNSRSELGFTDKEVVVAFIARLTFQKDPLTFIQSIPSVCRQVPNAKFLVVGDGELKMECIKLATSLKIQDKIRFLPFQKNIKELLFLIDIFVLPSLWEVIPLGLLEAMSMEKGCIATKIPGTTEAITHEENGLLINTQAPEDLASKIIQLASNTHLRRKLGKAARQCVLANFDIQTLEKRNEHMYTALTTAAAGANLLTPDLSFSSDNPFVAG